jgi:hypothetical protein
VDAEDRTAEIAEIAEINITSGACDQGTTFDWQGTRNRLTPNFKIIEETKKMEIPGCGRSLLCEICVSFLENLRCFLAAANGCSAFFAVHSSVRDPG